MGRRKPGLTIEQHNKVGEELQEMRDRLVKISVLLGTVYPIKTLKGMPQNALEAVDLLRSRLDDCVFQEHPERSSTDNAKVYYRSGEQ